MPQSRMPYIVGSAVLLIFSGLAVGQDAPRTTAPDNTKVNKRDSARAEPREKTSDDEADEW